MILKISNTFLIAKYLTPTHWYQHRAEIQNLIADIRKHNTKANFILVGDINADTRDRLRTLEKKVGLKTVPMDPDSKGTRYQKSHGWSSLDRVLTNLNARATKTSLNVSTSDHVPTVTELQIPMERIKFKKHLIFL